MKNENSNFIKRLKTVIPEDMEYVTLINNDKDKSKYIKRCETIIRSSNEYRDYIAFLKEYVDMDRCAFFQNITSHDSKKVKIEIHHEPFTLYDYVEVVVNKYISEGIPLNDLMIADEIMELHYNNQVGLIPLSKTIHEIIHNSTKLVIPLNMVYGEYSAFLSSPEYESYVEDLYDKLETKINATKNLTKESFDALMKEFTYIEMKDVDAVQKQEIKNQSEKLFVA
jgi:hypothetical protein